MNQDRYNTEYYKKRIQDNQLIKQHLIEQIQANLDSEFQIPLEELQWLNYEDLLELAVPTVCKDIAIVLGAGQDWDDGRDAKVSIARTHNYGQSYSAGVTGCSNKDHVLAVVYEPKQQNFYYFDFPVQLNPRGAKMTEHSIPFEHDGTPKRWTSRNGANKMWQFECETFKDACLGITRAAKRQQNCAENFSRLFALSA